MSVNRFAILTRGFSGKVTNWATWARRYLYIVWGYLDRVTYKKKGRFIYAPRLKKRQRHRGRYSPSKGWKRIGRKTTAEKTRVVRGVKSGKPTKLRRVGGRYQ